MSIHDDAREAVAALARAAQQVRECAEAVGAMGDQALEFDLDALAGAVDDALIEFDCAVDWLNQGVRHG
jgi:hypothetical protein